MRCKYNALGAGGRRFKSGFPDYGKVRDFNGLEGEEKNDEKAFALSHLFLIWILREPRFSTSGYLIFVLTYSAVKID
jgi:hypothetical protein